MEAQPFLCKSEQNGWSLDLRTELFTASSKKFYPMATVGLNVVDNYGLQSSGDDVKMKILVLVTAKSTNMFNPSNQTKFSSIYAYKVKTL